MAWGVGVGCWVLVWGVGEVMVVWGSSVVWWW